MAEMQGNTEWYYMDIIIQHCYPYTTNDWSNVQNTIQSKMQIPRDISLAVLINRLESLGFMSRSYNDINLTPEGRTLKEKGGMRAYYDWKQEEEVKSKIREDLGDRLLNNNVEITSDYRKSIKRSWIFAGISALLALGATTISLLDLLKKPTPIIKETKVVNIPHLRDTVWLVLDSNNKP